MDVNVHLSPLSETMWSSEDLSVEVIPPSTKKGKVIERGGSAKASAMPSDPPPIVLTLFLLSSKSC